MIAALEPTLVRAAVWLEGVAREGIRAADRRFALLVGMALHVESSLTWCPEALAWLREIERNSKWDAERRFAEALLRKLGAGS